MVCGTGSERVGPGIIEGQPWTTMLVAQLLRMGWFRPVHRKTVDAQEVRALLVERKLLQRVLSEPLPGPWRSLPQGPGRPSEPGAAQGDVRHRNLSNRMPRRPCRGLFRLRASPRRLQQLPQPALSQMSG